MDWKSNHDGCEHRMRHTQYWFCDILRFVTVSNGRFLLPRIVLYRLPTIRLRALEAVTSQTRTPGGRHFVFGEQ